MKKVAKVIPGMNTIQCPICRAANQSLRKKTWYGTLFVPVTIEEYAHMQVFHTEPEVTARCQGYTPTGKHHTTTVQLQV